MLTKILKSVIVYEYVEVNDVKNIYGGIRLDFRVGKDDKNFESKSGEAKSF